MRGGQIVRRLAKPSEVQDAFAGGAAEHMAARAAVPAAAPAACESTWLPPGPTAPMHDPPLAPRDEAIYLLHVAAEVEHSLMVEYLFAAYSLRDLPSTDGRASRVELIRHLLLHIAREEMAHLITVQNLLHLLGGPLHLHREHSPFASALLPFRFKLEPVSLRSLAKYVIAESPRPLTGHPDRDKIEGVVTEQAQASNDGVCVTHVGDIFKRLIHLFEHELLDDDVVAAGGGFDATWNDWGFQPSRRAIAGTPVSGDKSLVIDFLAGTPAERRARAIGALKQIADQGEGTDPEEGKVESHFDWFWTIYKTFERVAQEPGEPVVWNIAVDPNTSSDGVAPPRHKMIDAAMASQAERSRIRALRSRRWAQLFNLRYRLLLEFLAHFLRTFGASHASDGDRTARGYLLIGAFNEMRRLRKIARKVVQLPLGDDGGDVHAGPPFELPYTTELPELETERWRRHLESIRASALLVTELRKDAADAEDPFLVALEQADATDGVRFMALARNQPLPAPPQDFQKVVRILEEAVRGFSIGVHGAFWRSKTRDEFVGGHVQTPDHDYGPPIHQNPDGSFDPVQSELVRRLRGQSLRMPRERPPVAEAGIRYIEEWIRGGARDPHGSIGLVAEPEPADENVAPPTPATPTFAADVRPLFRQFDIDSMRFRFDLSSFEEVRTHASDIFAALDSGTMPCDGAWPTAQIALFKNWIDGGMRP